MSHMEKYRTICYNLDNQTAQTRSRKDDTQMKIYQVVDGRAYDMTEEDIVYLGTDFEAAKEAKERVTYNNNNYLTASEICRSYVAARIYEISDDIDLSDKNKVLDAICECCGCDTF